MSSIALRPDELTIMQAIADGKHVKSIKLMKRSGTEVTLHAMAVRIYRIRGKLSAKTTAHAVAIGFRKGLLK